MIPKKFHYIWIGPYSDSQTLYKDWSTVTPFELMIWDNITAKTYIKKAVEIFGGIENITDKSYTYISDMIRLLILKDYGGVYLDHDIILTKDIRPLLDKNVVLTFQYSNEQNELLENYSKGASVKHVLHFEYNKIIKASTTVNNCFIASIPNHKFIDKAIDLTVKNHFANVNEQFAMSDWGVGPAVFTEIAKEIGFDTNLCNTQIVDDVKILHKDYLHPVHGNTRFRLGKDHFDREVKEAMANVRTYGIHLHEHHGAKMFIEKIGIPIKKWYETL